MPLLNALFQALHRAAVFGDQVEEIMGLGDLERTLVGLDGGGVLLEVFVAAAPVEVRS